jgi:hypothetical protein
MDPVTSGTNPVPANPAIVAPLTPLLLDDATLFWDANTFALTRLSPDINLTGLPVTWSFDVTSGFLNANAQVVVAPDRRSARLEIPFPSWGNLGEGRMQFRVGGHVYAEVSTVIKNVQPDLEPGDFRFQVNAHLCTDGAGTSTTRTEAEVRTIMSDVTKVLSQCGIYVTLNGVVETSVPVTYVDDLDSGSEKKSLFGFDADPTAIDVFFVKLIDTGAIPGVTLSSVASTWWEPGVAIADAIRPPDNDLTPVVGQHAVRLVAHEITHYLLNHLFGDADHHPEDDNLLYDDNVDYKRDLEAAQCLELRTNSGGT